LPPASFSARLDTHPTEGIYDLLGRARVTDRWFGTEPHADGGMAMIIDIRPTVDLAFKLMLGSPEHTAVTVHFLNSVLGGSPRIQQVTILNPFLGKKSKDDKLSVLDIRAQDEHGRYLNIEMQTSRATGLAKRLTYYAGRLFVGQMREGKPYSKLQPAISICVLTQSMFPAKPQLHLDFRLREQGGQVFMDDLQIHLVELPKSRASAHNMSEVSPLERWAFLMLNAHQIDADELRRLLPEPEFHNALGVLEMITRTPETREMYEARLKAQLDEEARLDYARAEGEQIGQQRGEQIGQIRLLENLLKMPPTTSEELAKLGFEQLAMRLAELQRLFREQMK
jgi:predicted transposase/invertase (TIGR01784 family)